MSIERSVMKRRIICFSIAVLCFVICYIIVIGFSDSPIIRGFLGDIVVIFLIYFFIKGFYAFKPIKLTVFTILLAYATEFMQYLNVTEYLGLEHNAIAQLVLGAVFDPLDLLAYTTGGFLVYIIDTKFIGVRFK